MPPCINIILLILSCRHNRVGRGNAPGTGANYAAGALVLLQPHVALLSPTCAPRVLDQPVGATVDAVPHHRDLVVEAEVVVAVVGHEDALLVLLEPEAAGGDGHGHRLVGDGLGERGFVQGHLLVAANGGDYPLLAGGEAARPLGLLVRVGRLGGDAAAVADVGEEASVK